MRVQGLRGSDFASLYSDRCDGEWNHLLWGSDFRVGLKAQQSVREIFVRAKENRAGSQVG